MLGMKSLYRIFKENIGSLHHIDVLEHHKCAKPCNRDNPFLKDSNGLDITKARVHLRQRGEPLHILPSPGGIIEVE